MATNTQNVGWPGWETVGLIGRGSFGSVYEIRRDIFGETEKAALKVISIPQNEGDIDEMYSDGYDEESITSTFQSHLKNIVAEYSLMKKMTGSLNIVGCEDVRYVQHDDGIGWDIFIKMELLTPLIKALPERYSEEMVVKLAEDMCAALILCKKHNIVHRDIKPQNIFISPYGDYKLGDFGIAKTVEKTMGGTKIGTYKYMAPEVYHNEVYGSAADIYSLGLVLYWLMNERRMPFLPLPPEKIKAGMEETARRRRFSGEPLPEPANGSAKLKKIVMKACAYSPSERYGSAADMLRDLRGDVAAEAEARRNRAEEEWLRMDVYPDEETRKRLGKMAAEEAQRKKEEEARRQKEEEERRRREEEARRQREVEERQKREEEEETPRFQITRKHIAIGAVVASLILLFIVNAISTMSGWINWFGQTYYYVDGVRRTGWEMVDGNKYFFDDNGVLQTGWVTDNGYRYYLGENGVCYTQKGWKQIDGAWYYFTVSGRVLTGWQDVQGISEVERYYFDGNGVMQTGRIYVGDKNYWLSSNGVLQTNKWYIDDNGHWFYYGADGAMLTGRHVIDGISYYFNEYGVCAERE